MSQHLWIPSVGQAALLLTIGVSLSTAAAPDQRPEQVSGWFRMMVDDHEVTALYDGYTAIETQLLKGKGQDDIREHLNALFIDTEDGVQTAVNAFLINTGENLVLVDAGSAACFGPTLGHVEDNLRASGYQPEDVDTILMTHLHPDHVCGLTNDGEAVYPNAELRASQQDADFWLSASRAEEADEGQRAFFEMAQDAVAPYLEDDRFTPFEPGDEMLMGIVAQDTHGHTPGHTSFMLSGDDDAMLVWGDVVHSYGIQFDDPTVAIEFDSDPAQAIEARQAVLEEAVTDKYWVAGAHMPFPGIGHIIEDGDGYQWLPIEYHPLTSDKE
ncbi:MBL fold metallo-hydrolase [Halomonas sp. HL-93]|uniref:MBL fold metallo-hydrolase n=1 Tax=Halomonas sp. HL-93 TaxID=1666906 RepID=UPI0006DA9F3D|nr:MBL fold metallo-hydrolase [Halomonas sp. HL-93]KPQ22870.1 MAG: Zn-dependent hydrolase [Halomonas sp. HL-93]SBR46813.1 Glyoxylase, beta-lactamase superfamily II [Halomonas sp. HL-93]